MELARKHVMTTRSDNRKKPPLKNQKAEAKKEGAKSEKKVKKIETK